VSGTLYGTTQFGGVFGNGTVYKISTSGAEIAVYSFAGGGDGANPYAGLTNVAGTLYGTTDFGGASGSGAVYKIVCKITVCTDSVLHSFAGGSDGAHPSAELINVAGTLYGTTEEGGTGNNGTIYKIATSGAETVLYSFAGGTDGADPAFGCLINLRGTLYGMTYAGGTSNDGTIYKVTTSGVHTVLYSFAGGIDGANPYTGLTNVNGTLFGTTYQGGTGGFGTIFALANKSFPEFVLYSFKGRAAGDGAYPLAGLTNVGGTLYGTTEEGGDAAWGTVFALSLGGADAERIIGHAPPVLARGSRDQSSFVLPPLTIAELHGQDQNSVVSPLQRSFDRIRRRTKLR